MKLELFLVFALVLDVAGVAIVFVTCVRASLRNRRRAVSSGEMMGAAGPDGSLLTAERAFMPSGEAALISLTRAD